MIKTANIQDGSNINSPLGVGGTSVPLQGVGGLFILNITVNITSEMRNSTNEY